MLAALESRLRVSVYKRKLHELYEDLKKIDQKYNEVDELKDETRKVKEEVLLPLPIYGPFGADE